MDDTPRRCKFCGIECTWSDRGRADCYICGDLRARLSEMARVQREWSNMVGELMRVQAENQQLRADLVAARERIDVLTEERDKAWHIATDLRQRVAANGA